MAEATITLDLGEDEVSLKINKKLEVREILKRCGIEIDENQNFTEVDDADVLVHLDSGDVIDPERGDQTLTLYTETFWDDKD